MNAMKVLICLLFIVVMITSCTDSSFRQYETLMKNELASGKRTDSLFFGIYFGMTSKQFFGHCWELNRKGIFTDGVNNMYVLYKLKNNELQYPASMNFYPDFFQNKIYKMRVNFQYDSWAPWNKQLYADSLLPDVLKLYKSWYTRGNPFIKINDKEKGALYVKVDGNRRITIGRYNDMLVKVDYTDLLIEEEMKKEDVIK
jgi:hypothetical protein